MKAPTRYAGTEQGRIDPQQVIKDLGPDRVIQAFADLGVTFIDHPASSKGWKRCFALGREDPATSKDSAAVNVYSGFYTDRATLQTDGKKALHLFNFAMEHDRARFPRWIDAARHYATLAGQTLGRIPTGRGGKITEAIFDYCDVNGDIKYKTYRYREPNGKKYFLPHVEQSPGQWRSFSGCMNDVQPLPFGLPQLLRHLGQETVYVVEGEGKVQLLWAIGCGATSSHGGCKAFGETWAKFKPEWFRDGSYVLLPDHSADGRRFMESVAQWLRNAGAVSVKILCLPDLARDQDIIQWIDQGGTPAELRQLTEAAAEWHGREPGEDIEEDPGVTETIAPEPTEAWPEPILDTFPPSPSFPLTVLPEPLARLAAEGGRCIGCPPDYLAMAILTVAGAAVGRSAAIRLKGEWPESGLLYTALVGDPGMAKSPAVSLISRPIWEIGRLLMAQWKEEKAHLRQTDPEADIPTPQRMTVSNTTVEALIDRMAENPRGLLMVHDELSAFFAGHNQYRSGGKGADRQFYLSNWSGAPVTVDRKGNAEKIPTVVHHPFLSILGSMTPSMLSEMQEGKHRDDGMLDRFLMIHPPRVKVRWTDDSIPRDLLTEWSQIVQALYGRAMVPDADGEDSPTFLVLTADARDAWADWFDRHNTEAESLDFPGHLLGAWAKFRQYAARLALILESLHWAADPREDVPPVAILPETMASALILTEYLKAQTRRVRLLLRGATEDDPDGRAVLRWILKFAHEQVSERDIRRNFPSRFAGDERSLERSLEWLKKTHCLRLQPTEYKGSGRMHSPVYKVNPRLTEIHRRIDRIDEMGPEGLRPGEIREDGPAF